ncbi:MULTISPECIES: metal ABC transporter substrate-binding protein [Actinotignum]|uniref:metal ABC transporter substrate-binding protein n=1 Tax=Actinotignum TaxID=1653174 RepID=UPI00254CEC17|nr:metal ABC transporter substrate-binding protein [Actinotignum schaalii]
MKKTLTRMVALLSCTALLGSTALLAGCQPSSTSPADSASSSAAASSADAARIGVTASFTPIRWLAEQIGGDYVTVTSATPTNVEPHDYEFSPKQVAELESTDVIFYVSGFQPSLDAAISTIGAGNAVNLADAAKLVHHRGLADNHGDEATEAGRVLDPHFWLDPVRMQDVAEAITASLSSMDPEHRADFEANFARLKQELTDLNSRYTTGLAQCATTTVVSSHAAFGYLTDRYNLVQVGIAGIDPDQDPSPLDISEVKRIMAETGTRTIFAEANSPAKTAEAIAAETGAQLSTLSTAEADPEGAGYLAIMDSNLAHLREGLQCQ